MQMKRIYINVKSGFNDGVIKLDGGKGACFIEGFPDFKEDYIWVYGSEQKEGEPIAVISKYAFIVSVDAV
jgi:hypothetical protein